MRANPRVLFAAGLMAGAAVGALDGVRVSVLAHLDLGGLLACVVLTAAIDALAGAALGAVAALLLAVGRWGRAVRPGRLARVLGWVVTGGLVALVAAGAVMATALRMNRFLAAGVVCVAALVAGFAGAVAAPAVSRILGRSEPAPSPLSAAGVWLAAPLTGLALAVAMFVPLWRVRPPLRADARLQLTIVAAALAALLPAALDLGSRLFPSLPRRWARLAAALGFGLPAVAVVWIRWIRDFQFLRWNDVIVLGAIAVGALVLRRGKVLVGVAGVAAAAALVLIAGVSEPARKAASARAGLAAPVLDAARVALDFDHDGFPSLLGGGDCNDHDPEVHPGAQEWPDDGVDQNCDGKDASAAALRAPPLASVPESVPADLNLVLVTVDTLRADHLGCYGYGRPTSPEIDRFAQGAVLFENGWAHAPSTRYSMPAIATGRWPTAIDWDYSVWWPRIGRADATLGEAMKASGYTTGALYAFHYFNRAEARGFERGIDDYQDQRASLHEDINGNPAESKGTSAREIADDAIAFFNRNKDHKFFLWVHFYDPHFDYAPHPGGRSFGPRQIDLYDGEIWFTDEQMGRVLAELDRLELTGKTAVLLTGDHGEGFGEHGITTHGYHLYAPQTRVPFILKVPGLAPRRVTTPVGHVDIAPTFVNLARGKPQPTFLGRSMVDLAAGAPLASPPRPVLQDFDFELGADMHGTRRSGLVTESHHLLWNATPDNTTECYDRRSDPGEVRDLWGSAAGAPCRAMKSELQDLISVLSLPADFAEKLAAGVSAPGRPAPAPVHPVDARLGTAIRFEGYDLDPPVVSRGGEVQVVYHYEVLAPVPKGYRPFVHLDGPGGVRILDHVPVEGTLPAERWRPGQHIRDRQRIAFPATLPPGRYTLYTGFFHRTDRLPVSPASAGDGANRLRVAVIDLR